MSNEFTDRVVLITGGSRGIGKATALRLAHEGAHIAFSYASRSADAEETAAAIRALGRRAVCRPCNVANPDDVKRLVDDARKLGPIDYLVHAGAISNIQDHTTLNFNLWREMIDVNLTGTYLAVFAVKDEMISRKFGRIVTLSSAAAVRPRKMQIHYASAKAGVMAFTRCCAEAFAPHNVRVNCVAPGLIDTEMARALTQEMMQAVVDQTPMGRMGTADEIAAVIRFLLSEESSFMTGHTLGVSGGRIMLP
ncbi:MAG TPA: SDR family NAD(P)-dependent oxidoreductase [Gemmataceae bacterium]|nr:SDR family NAD(P)-dependent oxidoreductase [Gemmataceae bacterium]